MQSRFGFWLPVSIVCLALVASLAASWGKWALRQHRLAERLRIESIVSNGLNTAAELARQDILDWLVEPNVITYPVEVDDKRGVSGLILADGRKILMEGEGSFDFPPDIGFQLDWAYRVEDLNLQVVEEAPEILKTLDDQWRQRLLRGKRNRAAEARELPDWVVSPAPAVLGWRLDAAIYATPLGTETNNCAIRLRFHLDLELWNPWQEPIPLALVNEGSRTPAWRWVASGMPEVNLINHSLGVETGFIAIDTAYNESRPQESLLAAWVEPYEQFVEMDSAGHWLLQEPHPRIQAQGLARLLHRSFPIRPADRIELRFRASPGRLNVSLSDYDSRIRPQEIDDEAANWRMLGIPLRDFSLFFDRADQQPNPILRPGQSQDYRRHNAQFRFQLRLKPDVFEDWIYAGDPRRSHWQWDAHPWPESRWTGADFFEWKQHSVVGGSAMVRSQFPLPDPLFYPVSSPPKNYSDWQMFPTDWGGGPGLGRAIDQADQMILNSSWFGLPEPDTEAPFWMPVNASGYAVWESLFQHLNLEVEALSWWVHYRRSVELHNKPFRNVAELVLSGVLDQEDSAVDSAQLILNNEVVWARHGRHFAIVIEVELRDLESGETLQRIDDRRQMMLTGSYSARWVE